MTYNLHEVVPLFSLYLNVENTQHSARKHFDRTKKQLKGNSRGLLISPDNICLILTGLFVVCLSVWYLSNITQYVMNGLQ